MFARAAVVTHATRYIYALLNLILKRRNVAHTGENHSVNPEDHPLPRVIFI